MFAQEAVPNRDPVNPNVDVVDPVTTKLPVITAEPVKGNVAPAPPGMFIDAVFDETVAVTPSPVKLKYVEVPCIVPSSATVIGVATLGAHDADIANEAVPNREPVNPCVAVNEPDIL